MTRQDGSAKAFKGLFIQPLAFVAFLLAMLGSGPAALATAEGAAGVPAAFQSAPAVFERALPAGFQMAAEEVSDPRDSGFDPPALPAASTRADGAAMRSPATSATAALAPRPLARANRARAPPLS